MVREVDLRHAGFGLGSEKFIKVPKPSWPGLALELAPHVLWPYHWHLISVTGGVAEIKNLTASALLFLSCVCDEIIHADAHWYTVISYTNCVFRCTKNR